MNGSLEQNQHSMLKDKQKSEKGSLGHIAEIFDIRFYSPIPIVLLQELVLVEESVAC